MTIPDACGPASIRTTLREAPAAVWTVLAGTFINKLGSFLQVFLVLYLTRRGFTADQAGLALGAYGAGSIVGVASGGAATDWLGCRGTIAGSMILSALLTAALIFAPTFPSILVIVALTGAAAQAYRPASSALLAALTPRSRHVMVFAAYRLAFNVGMAVGPILGAFFAQSSFALLLWADALTSLAFGTLALFALPKGASRAPEEHPARAEGGYLRVLSDRRYLLFLGALFLNAVVYVQYLATLPLHVSAAGFSPRLFGALVSLNALIVILCELPITQVVQHYPARAAVALGIGLVGVGMSLYAFPASVAVLAFATVLWSLGEIIGTPAASAYPARIASPSLRGRYLAAAAVPQSLGYALGPVLGTALWTRIGAGFFWFCGLLTVVAVGFAMAGVRREAAQGERASA